MAVSKKKEEAVKKEQEETPVIKKEPVKKSKTDLAIEALEKEYGKGTVIMGDEKTGQCDVVSTGSIGLDFATGIMGLPRGRIVEILGPESSGKTTICLKTMANAQKVGKVAFIDMEHSLDIAYAKNLGVDIDNMFLSQPQSGEEALNIAKTLILSGEFSMVVVDSVAALVPKSELDGEIGDPSMAKQARLMSQAMRSLTGATALNNTLLMFTNQIRYKIGIMFGNPETTTGGNALKFYASMRLDVRRVNIKDGEEITGGETKVKILKSKVSRPFRVAKFKIRFGEGIVPQEEILDIAIENNVVKKSGTWIYYGDLALGQGAKNAIETLKKDNTTFEEIKTKVIDTLSNKPVEVENEEATES